MGTIPESARAHNVKPRRSQQDSGDPGSDVVLALTTWPDAEIAGRVGHEVVASGLAACVTLLARHRAIYAWKGVVEEVEESQMLLKTTRARLEALRVAIHDVHPYETPEWIVIPIVDGSSAYLAWVRESTRQEEG